MSEAIISVENLGKKYRIQHQQQGRRYVALRDVIARKFAAPFKFLREVGRSKKAHSAEDRRRKLADGAATNSKLPTPISSPLVANSQLPSPRASTREDFWALRDVSFEVKQGEVIGIIGRNGAGKSTLLKILSRITEPTEGRVRVKGRVASLLEVGTGFHPELTGRENIFLNGAILGMHRAEIKRKFDEIVAFAEVEKFLDTPVKRYSSGMYVRLAFAVAAHLEPEILIVDEVLAVGDAEFQKKCLGKMQAVSTREGRTVLFVSHNMAAITRLCQKGILLNRGSVEARGKIESVVNEYLHSDKVDGSAFIPDPAKPPPGNDIVNLVSVAVVGADGSPGPNFSNSTRLKIEITYRVLKLVRGLRIGLHLQSPDGTIIFNTTDMDWIDGTEPGRPQHVGLFASSCIIPPGLLNHGQFSITVGSDTPMTANFYCENVVSFSIMSTGSNDPREENRPGFVCPNLQWKIQSVTSAR
jgi:lipopolysaccharide transport system ATP-binding protein